MIYKSKKLVFQDNIVKPHMRWKIRACDLKYSPSRFNGKVNVIKLKARILHHISVKLRKWEQILTAAIYHACVLK